MGGREREGRGRGSKNLEVFIEWAAANNKRQASLKKKKKNLIMKRQALTVNNQYSRK